MDGAHLREGEQAEGQDRPPKADVGVLFIHGIGDQEEGATVSAWGEALRSFYDGWFAGAADKPVDGSHAAFRQAQVHPEEGPAHAELRVLVPGQEGAVGERRMLLAESWWADTFQAPRYVELVHWSTKVLPWIVTLHARGRLRRVMRAATREGKAKGEAGLVLYLEVLYFLLALLMFPVAICVVVLVMLLGLLPVPWLRSAAGALQRLLAKTVGDSYALLEHPMQEAAILSKVRRDVEWLGERAHEVVVVAHSQGAAIAHQVLRSEPPAPVRSFVSFGSGLAKLHAIRTIAATAPPLVPWLLVVAMGAAGWAMWSDAPEWTLQRFAFIVLAVFVMLAGAVAGVFGVAPAGPSSAATIGGHASAIGGAVVAGGVVWWTIDMIHGVVAGAAMLLLLLALVVVERHVPPDAARARDFRLDGRIGWLDLWASRDPVSNGDLLDDGAGGPGLPVSVMVENRRSLVRDHSAYWDNTEVFTAAVAGHLAERAGFSLSVRHDDPDRLVQAAKRRRARLAFLTGTRFVALGAIGAVVYGLRDAVPSPVAWAHERALAWWLAVPFVDEPWFRWLGAPSQTLFLVAGVTGAVFLWYLAVDRLAWRPWTGREVRRWMRRKDPRDPAGPGVMVLGVAASGALAWALASGWRPGPYRPVLVAAAVTLGVWALVYVLRRTVGEKGDDAVGDHGAASGRPRAKG